MQYIPTLSVEKDTSSNGSVIRRHVRRRFSFGVCHQKTRAQAILLREMSSEGRRTGDSLAGNVIRRHMHRRCFCGVCHQKARA